jgi:hypothetical protein
MRLSRSRCRMKRLWPLFFATDLRVARQRCLKGAVIEYAQVEDT